MKTKIRVLLLFVLLPILAAAQEDSSFVKMGIKKGSPASLASMNYFSDQKNFSYAGLYCSGNDTLFFVTDNSTPDSTNYILAYISNNYLAGYNYLKAKKIGSSIVKASGSIKTPGGNVFNVEINIAQDKISYKLAKDKGYVLNNKYIPYPVNKSSGPAVRFALGQRIGYTIMLAQYYDYKSGYGYHIQSAELPIDYHVAAGLSFSNNSRLELRFGLIDVYSAFNGIDIGLFYQTRLFQSNFYWVTGYDNFMNAEQGHGTVDFGGDINFICGGGGLNISKNFEVDLIGYYPLNKSYGHEDIIFYNGTGIRHEDFVNFIVNIGCQYTFIF